MSHVGIIFDSTGLRDSNCLLLCNAHLPIHCPSSHLESLWNCHAPIREAERPEVDNKVNPDVWPSICWLNTTFKLHSAAQRKGAGEELHRALNITFHSAATSTSFTSMVFNACSICSPIYLHNQSVEKHRTFHCTLWRHQRHLRSVISNFRSRVSLEVRADFLSEMLHCLRLLSRCLARIFYYAWSTLNTIWMHLHLCVYCFWLWSFYIRCLRYTWLQLLIPQSCIKLH